MALPQKTRAYISYALIAAAFLYSQFNAEVYNLLGHGLWYAIQVPGLSLLLQAIQAKTGYHTYTAQFWASILNSVLMCAIIVIALYYYTRSRAEFRFSLLLFGAALASILILNLAGKAVHNQWLETFARDTRDFVVSPFTLIFMIPLLVLARSSGSFRKA